MVSKIGQISIQPSSKKDPCGICCRKTMAIAVLCNSCGNLIHGSCAKIMVVTNTLAILLRCRKYKFCDDNGEDQEEELHECVERVAEFSYLVNRMYFGGGCEAAERPRTRLGWAKFRDCNELLCGINFLKKSKEVYTIAV